MCAGPLPWDLLSESSEEELTPRDRQSLLEEEEARMPVQQTSANGGGHPPTARGGVERAPAPDAKGMLAAKTMSIADQLATGLLTAGEHLQASALPFVPFGALPFVPFSALPFVPFGALALVPFVALPFVPFGALPFVPFLALPFVPFGALPFVPFGALSFKPFGALCPSCRSKPPTAPPLPSPSPAYMLFCSQAPFLVPFSVILLLADPNARHHTFCLFSVMPFELLPFGASSTIADTLIVE